MATEVISVTPVNFDEVIAAMTDAPKLAHQYVETAMGRGAARVRNRFIEKRLNGPPGIKGGVWKKQRKRHVRSVVSGEDLGTLKATISISRFLRLHEEGGTITASKKGRQALRIPIGEKKTLSTRGNFDEDGHINGLVYIPRPGKAPLLAEKIGDAIVPRFVLLRSVTIKARLGFRATVTEEWPREFPKVADAMHRAMSVALERRMKAVSSFVNRVTSL